MTRRRCPVPGYATKEAALAAAIRAYPCTRGKWHAGHVVLLA